MEPTPPAFRSGCRSKGSKGEVPPKKRNKNREGRGIGLPFPKIRRNKTGLTEEQRYLHLMIVRVSKRSPLMEPTPLPPPGAVTDK